MPEVCVLILLCICLILPGKHILALPKGVEIIHGTVQFKKPSNQALEIQTSHNSIIEFQNFNIDTSESVRFIQPGATSRVFNRMIGQSPTYINGSLEANGHVYLINAAGVFFGNQSLVDVAGLHAAAGALSNEDFLNQNDRFTELTGSVINNGHIRASEAVYLVGREVVNRGDIVVDDGMIALASGEDVLIGTKDSRLFVKIISTGELLNTTTGVSNEGSLSAGKGQSILAAGDIFSSSIHNSGTIKSQDISIGAIGETSIELSGELNTEGPGDISVIAHKIGIYDALFKSSGPLKGGRIFIGNVDHRTSHIVHVDDQSSLDVSALDKGNAGEILIWADRWTRFDGAIHGRGGMNGGHGGFAEVSAKGSLYFHGTSDLSAQLGDFGTLLFDPTNITIANAGSSSEDGLLPTINFPDLPGTMTISNTALNALASTQNITLEATSDITVNGALNLATANNRTFTLTANDDIHINASIDTGSAVTLTANDDISINAAINAGNNLTIDSTGTGTVDIAANISTTNDTITISADQFSWSGTINSGTGNTTLNVLNGNSVDIGANNGGTERFDQTNLDAITSNNVTITTTGAMNIDGITPTATITGTITLNNSSASFRDAASSFNRGLTVTASTGNIDVLINLDSNGTTLLNSQNGTVDVDADIDTSNNHFILYGDDFELDTGAGATIDTGTGDITIRGNNNEDIDVGASAFSGAAFYVSSAMLDNMDSDDLTIRTAGTGDLTIDGIVNSNVNQFDDVSLIAVNGDVTFDNTASDFTNSPLIITSNNNIVLNVDVDNDNAININVDADDSGAGDLIINGINELNTGGGDLDINAADILLTGTINTGAGSFDISATNDQNIVLGTTGAGVSLTLAELTNITSSGTATFTTTNAGDIHVDGVNAASTANFTGTITLDPNDDLIFENNPSTFTGDVTTSPNGQNTMSQDISSSTGTLTFNNPTILTTDITITTNAANQNIVFNDEIDSDSGNNHRLDLDTAANGNITLDGDIGSTNALSIMDINPGAGGIIMIGASSITSTTTQNYHGGIILTNDTVISNTIAGNDITFDSTIDSDGTIRDLTITSLGNIILDGNIGLNGGAGSAIDVLDLNSAGTIGDSTNATEMTANARATTANLHAGTDGFGDLTLTSASTIQADSITLEAGDGTGGAASAATIDVTTNAPNFLALAGGASSPASFTLRTDAQILETHMPLVSQLGAGPSGITINLESEDSNVSLNATPEKFAASNLTINGVSGATHFNTSFTGVNALSSIDVTGTTQLEQDISTTGDMDFHSDVTLEADIILIGDNITFHQNLNSDVTSPRALSLDSTTLTTFNATNMGAGSVGGTNPLASIDTGTSGSTLSSGSGIFTTLNQSYDNTLLLNTLNAAQTLSSTSGALEFSSNVDKSSIGDLTLTSATGTTLDGVGNQEIRASTGTLTINSTVNKTTAGDLNLGGTPGGIDINDSITVSSGALTLEHIATVAANLISSANIDFDADATFDGIVNQIINAGTGILDSAGDMIKTAAGSLTLDADSGINLSIVGNQTIDAQSGDLTIIADVSKATGDLSLDSSTLINLTDTGNQQIEATVGNLLIGSNVTKATGNLTLIGGSGITLDGPAAQDIEVTNANLQIDDALTKTTGNLTLESGATSDFNALITASNGSITVDGDFTSDNSMIASNHLTLNNAGVLDGTIAQSFTATTGILTITNGLDKSLAGDISFTGGTGISINGDAINSNSIDQTYTGAITLTGDTTLSGTDLTFNSTVDGAMDIILNMTGATLFNAAVGTTIPIGRISGTSIDIQSTGTTEFTSTVATNGGINQDNGSGAITFRDNFTFGTGSISTLNGDVILDGLSSTLSNDISFGNSSADALTLSGGAVVLDSSASHDNIIINSTLNASIAGGTDLSLSAGNGRVIVNESIGATNEMGNLTMSGRLVDINAKLGATTTITITSINGVTVDGPIDPVTVIISAGDDIDISSAIVADSLITVTAGTDGSGSINLLSGGSLTVTDPVSNVTMTTGSSSGNITLNGHIIANTQIFLNAQSGNITRTGGTLTAATIDLDSDTGMGSSISGEAISLSGETITADTVMGDIFLENTSTAATLLSSLTASTEGSLSFLQSGGNQLTVTNAQTQAGGITISNAGAHLITNLTLGGNKISTNNSGGNIKLTTTGSGNIYIGYVEALRGTTTVISAYDIHDSQDDILLDLWSQNLTLNASNDIGGLSLVGNATDPFGKVEIYAPRINFYSDNNVYLITDMTPFYERLLLDKTPLSYFSKHLKSPTYTFKPISSEIFLIGKSAYQGNVGNQKNEATKILVFADQFFKKYQRRMSPLLEIRGLSDIFHLKKSWKTIRHILEKGYQQNRKNEFTNTVNALRDLLKHIEHMPLSTQEKSRFHEDLQSLLKPFAMSQDKWINLLNP